MAFLAQLQWPWKRPTRNRFDPGFHPPITALDRSDGFWITSLGCHQRVHSSLYSNFSAEKEWICRFNAHGDGMIESRDLTGRFCPGEVLLIPPASLHTWKWSGPWAILFIRFQGPRAALLASQVGGAQILAVRLSDPGWVCSLFGRMFAACAARRALLQSRLTPLLTELLLQLHDDSRRHAKRGRTAPANLQTVLQPWLTRSLEDPLPLSRLAAKCGLSPSHFSALFRRQTGRSPVAYVIDLRVRRARELLTTTREPIAAIGRRLGFADQLYFSRVFHRRTGLSPREYRKRTRATIS